MLLTTIPNFPQVFDYLSRLEYVGHNPRDMASFMLVPNLNEGYDVYKILKDEENCDVQKCRRKLFLKEALKLMNTNGEKRTSGLVGSVGSEDFVFAKKKLRSEDGKGG